MPTTAATSPGSAPYRVSRSTMSRSLKPTWPFSSRWIFHSEARIASPACSREMPASMRSRRSRDPTSMRRTVGPPGACCVIEAAYSRAGAGGRSPGSGTRRLGAKGVGRDLAVGARGASTWRPAGTAGARTGAQRDLLEEQRHQEGEHDERHPHEKDVVQGVGEGAEHEVAHGTGEPLDGLDVVGVDTGGSGPRLHSTAPNTAAPIEPPIWRKNVAELVAAPMSRNSTAFWMAVTIVCRVKPRPAPNRYSYRATCQNGVSTASRDSRNMAKASTTPPMIG